MYLLFATLFYFSFTLTFLYYILFKSFLEVSN